MEKNTQSYFHNLMLENLANTEDKTPNSFSYDITSSAAIVFEEMQRNIDNLFLMFNVDNLEGVELERRVLQITGLRRKAPTKASGEVIVTGESGTVIPKGSIFLAGLTEFVSLDEVIIDDSGQGVIMVEALEYGAVGDVVPRAISRLKSPISGVVDIYNPTEFLNGYDEEVDEDLRERYYDKLQDPPKGGNPAHYKLWATEVDGIWNAKVFRTWNGAGTVKVVLVGLDRNVVDDEMVDKVKEHIMTQAPIRYEGLTVVSATQKNINISVSIKLESGVTPQIIKEQIRSGIDSYLNSITFNQDFVSLAKVGGVILDIPGVLDYQNLRLNNTVGNVELGDEEIPEIGTLEVSEIE